MGKVVNRDRITVFLPNEMLAWLRAESERTGTPMSRIIEKALEPKMKGEEEQCRTK